MIKSKLGRFYIGDPCYVLSDEDYHDVWGNDNNFNDGQIQLDEEKAFMVHGTAYGDGEYTDEQGNVYYVDSGTLSVIPLEAVSKPKGLQNGNVVRGNVANLQYLEGVFVFNIDDDQYTIDTTYEDEEDSWDQEDDPFREELDEAVEETEETLGEVINRAHTEELDAINTYDTILSKTDDTTDTKLKEMIEEIKKDEQDHELLLKHYIETNEALTDDELESLNNKNDSKLKENNEYTDDTFYYEIYFDFSEGKRLGDDGYSKFFKSKEDVEDDTDEIIELAKKENILDEDDLTDINYISFAIKIDKDEYERATGTKTESLKDTTVEETYEVLKESELEKYWDAKEIKRRGFVVLLKFNFGTDVEGNNYIVTTDGMDTYRFYANTDEEAIKIFDNKEYIKFESTDVEINEDEDLVEQLLSIVDVEAIPERINELLNKIQPSEEPYITDDWIYDEVRVQNEPLTTEEINQIEAEGFYNTNVYQDIANENIHYDLDEDKIYTKTITLNGTEFKLMFKIIDYYNCVIKIYDIVEE